jgi:2'-5' RNA ligase
VNRDERLRLFCALCLPDETVERLVAWGPGALRGGRPVTPGNLHVTLAFLGATPKAALPAVADCPSGSTNASKTSASTGVRRGPGSRT